MTRATVLLLFIAAALTTADLRARAQRASGPPKPKQDAATALEEVRRAVEARLAQAGRKGATVTTAIDKRARRIVIDLRPVNRDPRDDASSALNTVWRAAVQRASAFDEITVRVARNYSVTCGRRALVDPTISLWGEGLTRTCREQRNAERIRNSRDAR